MPRFCITCGEEGKKKRSSYALYPTRTVTHCAKCVKKYFLVGLVDIITKKCIKCKKETATAGRPGTKERVWCSKCKPNDMVDNSGSKCTGDGCNTSATYGDPVLRKRTHCKKCAEPWMVLLATVLCVGCKQVSASFGDPVTRKRTLKNSVNVIKWLVKNASMVPNFRDVEIAQEVVLLTASTE